MHALETGLDHQPSFLQVYFPGEIKDLIMHNQCCILFLIASRG